MNVLYSIYAPHTYTTCLSSNFLAVLKLVNFRATFQSTGHSSVTAGVQWLGCVDSCIGGDHGGDVSPPTIKLSPPTIIGNKTIFFLNIVIWNKCTTTQGVLIINVKQCVFKFWKIMIPLFLKMVWFTCCFHRAGLPAAPCFSQLAK